LVPMHGLQHGDETPFFLAAGMFGNVLNLRHLALQLGTDRPFYGIQARGLFGEAVPHETFEEMARDYLAEVRQVQPHGPYLLGGFSGGGVAAFEMARQLLAEGEEVAQLVLLDTPAPMPKAQLSLREKVQLHLQGFRAEGPRYAATWMRRRADWRAEQQGRVEQAGATVADGVLHSTEIEQAFLNSLDAYSLRPAAVPATLLRPAHRPRHVFGPDRQIDADRNFLFSDNQWTPFVTSISVIEVPGDHDSMMLEPNVRVLAAHLRTSIADALDASVRHRARET
ncbi:MAG: thioesterase domain-containing protein, partial [Ilumatobacteraceae bacterium]